MTPSTDAIVLTFDFRSDLTAFVKKFFGRRASAMGMTSPRIARHPKIVGDNAWVELKQKGEVIRETGYLTLEVPNEFGEQANQIKMSISQGW